MKPRLTRYEHHGVYVWVEERLKGTHRDHCLCYRCGKFNPDGPDANCPIASRLFALCCEEDVVTPVFECPAFAESKESP